MSSLLPIRSDPGPGEQNPRVVDLEGEDADAVFGALSSDTARQVVASLHEEPRTQSEIAESLDTTVQNVRYHLDNLEEAGLVEVVDTWYSSRGNEMDVYAPADGALIVSGDENEASRLKTALSRLVGGVAVVGLASVLLQSLVDRFGTAGSPTTGTGGISGGAGGGAGAGAGAGDGGGAEFSDGGDGGAVDAGGTEAMDAPDTTVEATETATQISRTAADEAYQTTETATTAVTDGGGVAVRNAANASTSAAELATRAAETTAAGGGGGGIPPGVAFFLGGMSVLLVVTALWYRSRR